MLYMGGHISLGPYVGRWYLWCHFVGQMPADIPTLRKGRQFLRISGDHCSVPRFGIKAPFAEASSKSACEAAKWQAVFRRPTRPQENPRLDMLMTEYPPSWTPVFVEKKHDLKVHCVQNWGFSYHRSRSPVWHCRTANFEKEKRNSPRATTCALRYTANLSCCHCNPPS